MAKTRLRVSLKRVPAMRVTKVSVGNERLCYLLVADKRLKYKSERSRIVYIGTTEKGLTRISQSVATRADAILGTHGIHGVSEFKARVVTCAPRQHVKTWRKLERALLLVFREKYGEVPKLNKQGVGIKEVDEFTYFARSRIVTILEDAG